MLNKIVLKVFEDRRLATALAIFLFIVFPLAIMLLNYQVPTKPFAVAKVGTAPGETFVWTTEQLMKQELDFGWQPNDLFWPTVLLDNRKNHQLGVLDVVRYNVWSLREHLTRLRATGRFEPLVWDSFTLFSNDPKAWIFPRAEGRYRKGIKELEQFRKGLPKKETLFSPRSDNLIDLLRHYSSFLGGVNTALINTAPDINFVLGQETAGSEQTVKKEGPTANDKLAAEKYDVRTNWFKVDDEFYYARGVAWALYHSMQAVKIDFESVLTKKNSINLCQSIIDDLERCINIKPIYIFNGKPGGFLPNHLLSLSGPLNEVRQKIQNLIESLTTG